MDSQKNESKDAFVELKFGPKWKYISTVRTFIENFTAITIENKKQASNIAMAVNELVENAIKYSDHESIEVQVYVSKDEKEINVNVKNHARQEDVDALNHFLAEINSLPPLEAYMKRMQESAKLITNKSCIGLARIRYESNTSIECTSNNGVVIMHATIPVMNSGGKNE